MSKVSNEELRIRKEEIKKSEKKELQKDQNQGQKTNSNMILQVEKLCAGYENEQVIKDISFTLSKGEILCLAGESGSGKSTVLKALLSFCDTDVMDGDIRIFDTSVKDLAAKKRAAYCSEKMGVVFQNPGETFNPIRSYKKQFIETLKSHGKYNRATFMEQVEKAFEKVNLKDPQRLLHACPYALSVGMNQRMAIVLAILLEQEILLCDEPTSALDATIALQVIRELKRLRDECGIAQIIVTHDLAMAGYLADRIGVMHEGQIVEMGETKEILQHPKHPYTQSLLAAVPTLNKKEGAK